jgi:hypothetical protein
MIDNIAFVLVVGFWSLAATLVFLRLAVPRAPITGKFIEYLANVTVSHRDENKPTGHHVLANIVVSHKDATENESTSHRAAH